MGNKKGRNQRENQETIPSDRECQERCSRLFSWKEARVDDQMPGHPGKLMPASLFGAGQVSIVRLQMVKESRFLYGIGAVSGPGEAARLVRPLFEGADREMLVVLSLDRKNKPVAAEVVAVGGLSECVVDIRNLFKHAILANAAGIFLFHSHPSGEAVPSQDDRAVTERASRAGEILGIPLIDHIILGDGEYFSFREEAGKGGDGDACS